NFDLGLPHRDATDDKVTVESAETTLKLRSAKAAMTQQQPLEQQLSTRRSLIVLSDVGEGFVDVLDLIVDDGDGWCRYSRSI
ncbi:hypothetical protein FRX31_012024, partial [Thalictrum thalictroides]